MKERPILFSAPMVRALLDGTKTQTRRVVARVPAEVDGYDRIEWCHWTGKWCRYDSRGACKCSGGVWCPYGHPGDRLWVKEAIRHVCGGESVYVADDTWTKADAWPWKRDTLPGMFCPRGLSRIKRAVVEVRVQRVQEISREDAIAEGARSMLASGARWPQSASTWSMEYPHPVEIDPVRGDEHCLGTPQMAFANKWIQLNGKKPGCHWHDNPWVWAVTMAEVAP